MNGRDGHRPTCGRRARTTRGTRASVRPVPAATKRRRSSCDCGELAGLGEVNDCQGQPILRGPDRARSPARQRRIRWPTATSPAPEAATASTRPRSNVAPASATGARAVPPSDNAKGERHPPLVPPARGGGRWRRGLTRWRRSWRCRPRTGTRAHRRTRPQCIVGGSTPTGRRRPSASRRRRGHRSPAPTTSASGREPGATLMPSTDAEGAGPRR